MEPVSKKMPSAQSSEKSSFIKLSAAGLFFLAGPVWSPWVQKIGEKSLFTDAKPLVWLGASILAAQLLQAVLPSGLIKAADRFFDSVKKHSAFLGVFFLAVVALGLYGFNQKVLHSFLGSADEHSCYFLAECIRLGKWWVPPHPLSEFFNVVHVGNRDGKWFSVYPPGWPLLMAAGIQAQILDWLNPVLSALSLGFLYSAGARVYGKGAALGGIFFTALAPFFIFTSAAYFSHPTCLLAVSISLWAYLNWREEKVASRRFFWIGLCAAATGYGLLTRYLTMAAFITPLMVYHFVRIFRRKEKWTAEHTLFAGIIGLSVLLVLGHNFVVTGKPFKAPNTYDKRWERLGFRGDYTPLDGFIFLIARFFYLADWAPVLWIAGYFVSLWYLRLKDPVHRMFQLAFFAPAAAYFFYYSWGGNQFGPRYYYEGFPFLTLALAGALAKWRENGGDQVKKISLALVLVSFVHGAFLFHKQVDFYGTAWFQRKQLYRLAEETVSGPSLVFIHGFLGDQLVLGEEDAVRNPPTLDARILYAHDLGEKNKLLMEAFPGRSYYRGLYDRELKQAVLEKI